MFDDAFSRKQPGQIAILANPQRLRPNRWKALFAVLLCEIGVTTALIINDPIVAIRLHALKGVPANNDPNAAQHNSALKDLPVGTSIPNVGNASKMLGTLTRSNNVPVLVASIGECSSCIRANIREWETDANSTGVQLILVTSAKPDKATQYAKAEGLKSKMVIDPGSKLAKAINAWPGRGILFSAKGQVRWFADSGHFEPPTRNSVFMREWRKEMDNATTP